MGVVTGVRVKAEWVVFWMRGMEEKVITPPFWWVETGGHVEQK